MAQKSNSSLGTTVETKVCPIHTGGPTNPSQQSTTGLSYLEHSLAESHADIGACLLGNKRWRKCPVLTRLMEATQTTGRNGGTIGSQTRPPPEHRPKGQKPLETSNGAANVATMESFTSRARDSGKSQSTGLANLSHAQENTHKRGTRHFEVGILNSGNLQHQGSLSIVGPSSRTKKRMHLE